jgi:hypothetical protein
MIVRWVGNAVRTAQVDRVIVKAAIYQTGFIAENSALTATINKKTIVARVDPKADQLGTDVNSAKLLLTDFYNKWNSSQEGEFKDITCSPPKTLDNGDWYVDLTAKVAGQPFTVEINAPYPVVDVDTNRQGTGGRNASFSFWFEGEGDGGFFQIRWGFGEGTEISNTIAYPPTKASIKAAIVAGMPSAGDEDIVVAGAGTESDPWTVTAQGALAETITEEPTVTAGGITGGGEVFIATERNGGEGVLTDTFDGVDGTELEDHVSNDGTGWSLADLDAGRASLMYNELIMDSYSASPVDARWLSDYADNPDGSAEVIIKTWAQSASTVNYAKFMVLARYNTFNYRVWAEVEYAWGENRGVAVPGGGFVDIGRLILSIKQRDGGVTTTLATVDCDDIHLMREYYMGTDPGTFLPIYGRTNIGNHHKVTLTVNGTAISATVVDVTTGVSYTVSDTIDMGDTNVARYGLGLNTTDGGYFTVTSFKLFDGSDANEIQQVWLTDGAGGTFTLTKGDDDEATTAPISASTTLAAMTTALEAEYGAGNVEVLSGNGTEATPWRVKFYGALANEDIPEMVGDGAALTGYVVAHVDVIEPGTPPLPERWTSYVKGASGGTFRYWFLDYPSGAIAYNGNAAAVQAALEECETIGEGNVTVTGAGTFEDPWVITLGEVFAGKNVVQLVPEPDGLVGSDYPPFVHQYHQASGGTWHWKDRLNWQDEEGEYRVPETGDVVYLEIGDQTRCPLYDLDQSDVTLAGLYVYGTFTANAAIGLPRYNQNGYWEYRQCELAINFEDGAPIVIGNRGGGGSPLIKLHTLDGDNLSMSVYATAAPKTGEQGAIQWRSAGAGHTLLLLNGFVGASPYAEQTMAVSVTQHGGTFLCGPGTTIKGLHKTSGTFQPNSATFDGPIDIQG